MWVEFSNLKDELKTIVYINPLKKLKEENQSLKKDIKSLELTGVIDNKEFNFTKDILDKIIELDSVEKLNSFLENTIKKNIKNFTFEQFSESMSKLRKPYIVQLFNNESVIILKSMFDTKEWNLEERKIWCNLLSSLNEDNIDRKLFEWFENRKCLKVHDNNYEDEDEYWIDCHFLEDEIPF